MARTAVATKNTYAVFVCINSVCDQEEFAAIVTPYYAELPECPCCAGKSVLVDILVRREG